MTPLCRNVVSTFNFSIDCDGLLTTSVTNRLPDNLLGNTKKSPMIKCRIIYEMLFNLLELWVILKTIL